MDRKQERAFEEFVAGSGDALLRLATLLTSDQGLGEDVYQETLHRLAARWARVDNPRAFCRRVMHNLVIDQGRLQRRQVAQVRLAEGHDDYDPRSADSALAAELRPVLLTALPWPSCASSPGSAPFLTMPYPARRSGGSVMPPVDEDIMRELMTRATADLFAPAAAAAGAIRRQRRHRLRNRALGAAGTAAA
ncbi:MAG TPA: sigma factor, partial [Trebonia sp.]